MTVKKKSRNPLCWGLPLLIALPFAAGGNRMVAVKIVDDRGIESLKVIALP